MVDEHLIFKNFVAGEQKPEHNKKTFQIRQARISDARNLMDLIQQLVTEGAAYLTDRLEYSLQQQVEYIANAGKDSIVLVAESNNKLIGWINLKRNFFPFRQHTGTIVMGVKQELQNQGVGSQLLSFIEPMALYIKIERLELGVRSRNLRACSFYKRHGFIEEGRRIHGVKNNNQYDDEIIMAKRLR